MFYTLLIPAHNLASILGYTNQYWASKKTTKTLHHYLIISISFTKIKQNRKVFVSFTKKP